LTPHAPTPIYRHDATQQRVTPDVQTGCISCASGDGKFGGPIWWNTPLDDADADAEGVDANRTTWGPAGGPPEPARQQQQQYGAGRKRPAEDDDEDDMPDEVRARLEALKRAG
jgi:bud site selection protein 31